jgi:hypothetical protein
MNNRQKFPVCIWLLLSERRRKEMNRRKGTTTSKGPGATITARYVHHTVQNKRSSMLIFFVSLTLFTVCNLKKFIPFVENALIANRTELFKLYKEKKSWWLKIQNIPQILQLGIRRIRRILVAFSEYMNFKAYFKWFNHSDRSAENYTVRHQLLNARCEQQKDHHLR